MLLLIADDDDYTRQGLVETLDWERYGIRQVIQARDGEEALKLAARHQPDIVLTDIRMPKLNGIELAEKLVKKCRNSKLLLMSAFMDIEYLKSAIKLSAVDFIEKPIKLSEVEAAIQKTVNFLQEKQKLHEMTGRKTELERQKLAGLLKQKGSHADEMIRLCEATGFPANESYAGMVVWQLPGESREDAIQTIQSYWTAKRVPAVCGHLEENKYVVVAAFQKQERRRIVQLSEAFVWQHDQFCIGMGSDADRLADVPESCQTALAALGCSFYRPLARFFNGDRKVGAQQNLNTELYPEFLELLKHAPKKLPGWMEALCDQFGKEEYPPQERVCALFSSFALAMLREQSTLLARVEARHAEELERDILECPSIQALKQLMLRLTAAYIEELEHLSGYSRVVRDAMDYIAANCCKVELDVREIAEHVHLSTAHIGMLFKQDTGMTIKQYMGEYRLELAKKLIASEHYRINAVAELCGYASASYFTKVFRDATGVTPVEYRKRVMGS